MSDRLPQTDGERNEDRRKKSSFFQDARIDRGITWALGVAGTTGVAVLIAYSNGIDTKLSTYGAQLGELRSDVAVLKNQHNQIEKLEKNVEKLEDRLRALEAKK